MIPRLLLSASIVFCAIPAAAQSTANLPANTLSCAMVSKQPDGKWRVDPQARFDIGGKRNIKIAAHPVGPGQLVLGGVDLYALIERKCAKPK